MQYPGKTSDDIFISPLAGGPEQANIRKLSDEFEMASHFDGNDVYC